MTTDEVLVLYTHPSGIEKMKLFFERLGLEFVPEKHGNGQNILLVLMMAPCLKSTQRLKPLTTSFSMDHKTKFEWVMKIVPPWIGLCLGWFAALACYFGLHQGPLVFFALPAIGFLIGLRVSKRLNHYE